MVSCVFHVVTRPLLSVDDKLVSCRFATGQHIRVLHGETSRVVAWNTSEESVTVQNGISGISRHRTSGPTITPVCKRSTSLRSSSLLCPNNYYTAHRGVVTPVTN